MGETDLHTLRDSISRVLADICGRRAVHDFIDGKSNLAVELWAKAAELGWLGVGLPETYDGLGFGAPGWHTLHQELGRYLAPGPYLSTLPFAQWLVEVATDEQKSHYLPRIVSGELVVATPLSVLSPDAVRLQGEKLQGKLDILGAPTATLALIPTRSTHNLNGWALISLEAGGVSLEHYDSWDRTRMTYGLSCDGAAPIHFFADPHGELTHRLARHVALAATSDSLGGATAIAHQTVDFLKERVQFDKPVGSNQALKHRCADMIAAIATSNYVHMQAVECADLDDADADMWAALAKASACETYAFVAADCVQLHGGVGFTWEFDVHLFVKRARLNDVLVGNSRILRDFAAEALAKATRAGRLTTELAL